MPEILVHPQFDIVAFHLGPFPVRWYGLMYLFAFLSFFILGNWHLRNLIKSGEVPNFSLDDLIFYGFLGVILGGRLGYVLFYQPTYYYLNPLEILAFWKGGMSFHGGLLGVLASLAIYAFRNQGIGSRETHRHKSITFRFFFLTDFVAPLAPLGIFFGRIANFINGELYGRVADPNIVPWAMIFPQSGTIDPRHPSQIYQALGEGIILFVILFAVAQRKRKPGLVSAFFLLGYGFFRFVAEYYRQPDIFLGSLIFNLSLGQLLSIPMIVLGLLIFFFSRKLK